MVATSVGLVQISKRRFPRAAFGVAVGLVAMALLWWALAVPALVKYPTDLDLTPRYEGTFTLYVDPRTAAPLATPVEVPLEVERHIRAAGDKSGFSRVVVEETINQRAGDLINATQKNAYVMDRRTLQNVADDRAFAFDPVNIVDRSSAYRLNLPFDTSLTSTYAIYKNEIGITYKMSANTNTPTTKVAGLKLHSFTGSAQEVPLDAAYLTALRQVVPLPASMTLEQLKPQLLAAGLNVDAVLAAVRPVITPDDLTTLAQIATQPIPLQYVLSFEGAAGVETTTGAEVHVRAAESVGVRPVFAAAATLRSVLSNYPNIPEAAAAAEGLAKLGSAPAATLFKYHYEQTPASVADIADEVKSMRNQMRLAERYVPIGLLAAGVLTLVIGAGLSSLRRPSTIDRVEPVDTDGPVPQRHPSSSGVQR